MNEEHLIKSADDLRSVIKDPKPVTKQKVIKTLDEQCRKFIEHSPIIFMGTSDKNNNLDVSPKGDAPGFVHIADNETLLIPERPGNRLAFGFENILETGKVGLIFIVPGVRETLRVNGSAYISKDPELLEQLAAQGKPAILCTIIKVEECFMHCGKAMIRSDLWKSETWPENPDFSCAQQLADTFNTSPEDIQASLDDAYVNKLY